MGNAMRWGTGFLVLLAATACRPKPAAHEDAGPAAAVSATAPVTVLECPAVDAPAPALSGAKTDAPKPEPEVLVTRQVKTVRVNDVDETWVLRWRGKPERTCMDAHSWSTCPCWGFAYGESGHLELARLRPNVPEEILDFTKHWDGDPMVQRWIPGKDDDLLATPSEKHLKELELFDAMQLRDYDHDGEATEFVYRFGVGSACGHDSQFAVVGISKKNPKLHFFGINLPFVDSWETVRLMPMPGEAKIVSWACGDHGSQEEESILVMLDAKGTMKTKEMKKTCKE